MSRRFGAAYLRFSPLGVVVLFGLYHGVNLWAGIAGGAVHFALIVLSMRACGAFQQGEESGLMPGLALLVIGGAVVWATGPSGPPTPKDLVLAAYNNAGLSLGFFLTLLGFAAMVPALPSPRDRSMGSVGLVCFTLMFIIWLLESALGFVLYSSPMINVPASQRPEWYPILRDLTTSLAREDGPAGFMAGAVFAEVAIHAGWIGRRAGRLMSVYCAAGVLANPLFFILVRPGTASISELPTAAMVLLPFLPPATLCLASYYVGVLGLRHIAKVS